MNKYSLFMIIFIIINPIFSLKTEDLCIKNYKCKGKYGYDCGSKYCALSIKTRVVLFVKSSICFLTVDA